MIGQKHLIETVNSLESFPVFVLLAGPKGSGKKLVANYIGTNVLNGYTMTIGTSVSDIRTMIQTNHKIGGKCINIIADADSMSNEAKNALLKIIEEPPANKYFIMTIEDVNNTLSTIRSRAFILRMDRYTPEEISEYYGQEKNVKYFQNLCDTPGEVDLLKTYNVEQFYEYVEKVIDNIADVGISNALKIGDKIALKSDADGYDLKLFWKVFIDICLDRAEKHPKDILFYCFGIQVTGRYVMELKVRGINKQMLFTDWILALREEWI